MQGFCFLDNKMQLFFCRFGTQIDGLEEVAYRVSFSWLAGSRLQGRHGMGWFRLQPKVPWLNQPMSG